MKKVILDYKEVALSWRVEWRSVSMRLGALYVTIAGLSVMPMSFVNNWDSLGSVSLLITVECLLSGPL